MAKTKEPLGLALTKLILSTTLIVNAGVLIGAIGYLVSHPKIEPAISVAPNITIQPSPTEVLSMENWHTYRNEDYGFELKYSNNYEVLTNDPNGQKYPSFRDKKYNGAYEWPGLDISWPPPDVSIVSGTESKVFKAENAKDDIITINFTYNGDKIISASCKLYGDPEVINICNKIISTFKFIEKEAAVSQTVSKIINILSADSPEESSRYAMEYKLDDLDGNGEPELIVYVPNYDKDIYKLYIFSVLSKTENYKEIGQINSIGSTVPIIDGIKDINGDGVKEVFVEAAPRGGTGNRHAYSIIAVDFKTPKVSLIKVKNADGKLTDGFEFVGGIPGRCFYNGWAFGKNLNGKAYMASFDSIVNNGRDCTFTSDRQYLESGPDTDYSICNRCKISAYKWNGSVFAYDAQAEEFLKKSINLEEFEGNNCRTCESWVK